MKSRFAEKLTNFRPMANHIKLGKAGERLAVDFLLQHGYTILHQNWRYGRCEVDIIASLGKKLHFIEVKTRRHTGFGFPEEAVTKAKTTKLARAATEYQYRHPGWKWIQFDILSITLRDDGHDEFFFIEDIDV